MSSNEAMKVAIMAVRNADNLVNNPRPRHRMPRSSSPVLSQSTFDWKATDK